VLAPLEKRSLQEDDVARFALRRWVDKIRVADKPEFGDSTDGRVAALVGAVYFALAWGILAAFSGTPTWWMVTWTTIGVLFVLGSLFDYVRNRTRGTDMSISRVVVESIRSWGGQQLNFTVTLFLGIVLPGAAIFFAADAWTLIDSLRDRGLQNSHSVVLTLIGRTMQVLFVATASLAPGLLFFLFDREHLETMRDRFVRQIMRFDPAVETRGDVLAKYGRLMDEAYGRVVSGRILPGRRSPLLLGTLVMALGWTFTLLHGDVKIVDENGISSLFEPRRSVVSFAFLGAYFYGLNAVLRGYVRRDLRPKTYSALTVRILVVVVLGWVLELFWSDTTLYALAFLTGIVPETALVLIREALSTRVRRVRRGGADEETVPLRELEGMDLYDRARLFDEGVTNIQSLAEHDVVELMLQTRIPIARILDWVDQAILYLHAAPANGKGPSREMFTSLRRYGIRTATDLDNAFGAGVSGDPDPEKIGRLKWLVEHSDGKFARLQVIKDVLQDEEWIANLRHWREQENVVPRTVHLKVANLPAI
jgi:hypothetical protein